MTQDANNITGKSCMIKIILYSHILVEITHFGGNKELLHCPLLNKLSCEETHLNCPQVRGQIMKSLRNNLTIHHWSISLSSCRFESMFEHTPKQVRVDSCSPQALITSYINSVFYGHQIGWDPVLILLWALLDSWDKMSCGFYEETSCSHWTLQEVLDRLRSWSGAPSSYFYLSCVQQFWNCDVVPEFQKPVDDGSCRHRLTRILISALKFCVPCQFIIPSGSRCSGSSVKSYSRMTRHHHSCYPLETR